MDANDGSLLVTGGTGFLGLHTCQYFAQKEWDVTALDLKPFNEEDDTTGIDFVRGDVRDSDLVAQIIADRNIDLIVHAAAALPLWDPEKIRSVTIEGTRTVLQEAQTAGVKRVVYISSTAVYGTHETHPITEDSQLDGVGTYGNAKIKAEKACREFRDSGLCVPILRPKTFIGPQRLGVFQILFDWIEDGANVPLVGWGHNRYQLLHVNDLVAAIELMLTHEDENLVNSVFNVGAQDFGRMKEDFQAPIDYAGTGKRTIGTPALLTVWALRILNLLNLSPLYPWVYETAHEDSFVSVDKLMEIGWEPAYSNKEALVDTYRWYLDNYQEIDAETGLDHRVAWDQGALRIAKKFFQII